MAQSRAQSVVCRQKELAFRKRDTSYLTRYPRLVRKAISFWRHTTDCARLIAIFPHDAVAVWWRTLVRGLAAVFAGA